ncbi:DNA primase [Lederbergia citrisecunda]|uniref:DNA primase n=1 Tax=Lederbergia citrisecunda TaxID=2833583 RepID=UPI003D29F0A1
MTDLQLIKKRIYEEKRIEELLELLECTGVDTEQRGNLYVAALPDGENSRSVQVKNNESLGSSIRSRNVNGDIYDVVSYIVFGAKSQKELSDNLPKSKYWICNKLDYMEYVDEFYKETSDEPPTIPDYNKWLSKAKVNTSAEIPTNTPIDRVVLDKYGVVPYLSWILEGISYNTQIEFGVGIDVQSDRITFPVHDNVGNLIGVKGRYCGSNDVIEVKYKYLYLVPCNKSIEFYNLHRALPYIKASKEVIVVEGAKTVMLLHTWGYKNAISIEGDALSDIQIRLLKDLGLATKFIFAWDKDKDAEYVKNEVMKLQGRMRFAMLDTGNLLNKKDSPVDQGKSIWEQLLKEHVYRIR